jgi:predicted DNA-binding ribbon-helix-helix protein
MQSSIVKHSVVIAGHKTNVSLEEPFWRALKDVAASRRIPLKVLVSSINAERMTGNLSSAIRLFVLSQYYKTPSDHSHTRRAA